MCTQITRADDNLFFEFQPGFSHQINNVWKLSASEKLYYTGSGRFLGHATNVGLAYSGLTDWLTLSMNFKYAEKNSTGDSWIREYRPHFNVTVNDKIGEMPWSNRTRIEYRDFDEKKDRWRLRNKLILDMPFEIPVLNATPYIGDEVLFNLSENGYYQNRLYTGLKFKIAEDLKANLYYYWRKAKKSSGWDEASIIGANLTLKF
jgi:hypothetical protein